MNQVLWQELNGTDLQRWLQTGALATLLFVTLKWIAARIDRRDSALENERAELVRGLKSANEALAASVDASARANAEERAVHLELVRTQREILQLLTEHHTSRESFLQTQKEIVDTKPSISYLTKVRNDKA